MIKKLTVCLLVLALLFSMAGCVSVSTNDSGNDPGQTQGEKDENEQAPEAEADEEERGLVTVNIGRQVLTSAILPEGATWEDNAYIKMAEEELNIDIVDAFEAEGDDYDRQVSLAISANELPDLVKITRYEDLKDLYENDMIADLTEVYEKYANERVKYVYESYGTRVFDEVSIDGKMLAMPATAGNAYPGEVWVRSDWMEACGIDIDPDGDSRITLDDVKMLAKTFMEKNPGNAENVVGLAAVPALFSSSSEGVFEFTAIANAMGVAPKAWLEVEKGQIVYGSNTEEMKNTLALLADWYKEGIIDEQIGIRTWDDITALLINGQTGITFGTWHISDWLLNAVYAADPNVRFKTYVLEDADGNVNVAPSKATNGYYVVRKDFSNPEILVELVNLYWGNFNQSGSELREKYPEAAEYAKEGVDGSARPLNMELIVYGNTGFQYVKEVLDGERDISTVGTGDQALIPEIQKYMDGEVTDLSWARYHSRMEGLQLYDKIKDEVTNFNRVFPVTTDAMTTYKANLDKMMEETFIKIVTGELDVEEGFSQYVQDWNDQGGTEIIDEIVDQLY